MEQTSAYCARCARPSLVARPGVNHVLHLVLTLFLCGVWFVPWMILALFGGGAWRCQSCGGEDLRDVDYRSPGAYALMGAGALIALAALAVAMLAVFGRLPTGL